jgi:hypothetical protein
MSGAAAIAAAKNRRGRTEPAPKSQTSSKFPAPIQTKPANTCSRTDSSCAVPNKKNTSSAPAPASAPLLAVNQESLQITGPMHPIQILTLHEQRMNRFDERLNKAVQDLQSSIVAPQQRLEDEAHEEYLEECFNRLDVVDAKLNMLEEVIGNLQNKLTNVQNYMIETNLAVMKLTKSVETAPSTVFTPLPSPDITAPASPTHISAAGPEPAFVPDTLDSYELDITEIN